MPRAHRYCLPHHIWHITHRCHQRAFLLNFARDRGRRDHERDAAHRAGRTAQEYNQRKGRQGAFWEDRYHAPARYMALESARIGHLLEGTGKFMRHM